MDKRGREYHDLLSKIFCLSAEKFRRATLCCVTNAGIEKFYASEGYLTIFCRNFCLTVPKNSLWEAFSVSLILGIKKC